MSQSNYHVFIFAVIILSLSRSFVSAEGSMFFIFERCVPRNLFYYLFHERNLISHERLLLYAYEELSQSLLASNC